jgi:hypothetical protein
MGCHEPDAKGPLTSASYLYSSGFEDPERAPDTFSVTWKYDSFVATFTNATPPGSPDLGMSDLYGNWFYGQKAVVLVNRYGYELKPVVRRPRPGAPAPAEPPPVALPAERNMDPEDVGESRFQVRIVHRASRPQLLDCVKSRSEAPRVRWMSGSIHTSDAARRCRFVRRRCSPGTGRLPRPA